MMRSFKAALACLLICGSAAAQVSPAAPSAVPPAPPERPITLEEAYALTLKRSETIAADLDAVKQALARVDELRSDIMPHVSFIGQETFQESPHSGIASVDHTSIPLYQFQATQPLFSGFREFLAFKSGKKTAESLRLTERRAESLLYQDVTQAYLNVLQIRNEIEIRGEIIKATSERIDQLRHWVKIGRSRESEVLAARSQLAQTEAQVELARGSERVAQEALRFLTGVDAVFAPQPLTAPTTGPIDAYLSRARARDDVQASERNLEAARLNTQIAARQRWGTVGLTADYYLKRLGLTANTHYDAVLGLNLPLFDGGVISAQTREAKAAADSAAQSLSAAQRGAERDTRTAYVNLASALQSVSALQTADELAADNVKAQEQDYKLSLVTNLDVLDSLNTLQATRLLLNSARQQAQLARAQLEVAAGGPDRPAQEPR